MDNPQQDDLEPPKKKASKVPTEAEGALPSPSDVQDIKELLASTKKQIEEKKRQTQSLLAQQGLAQPPPPPQQPLPLAPQGVGVVNQAPLLQTPRQQQGSVHPLAYSRELHLVRGSGLGPSALDKAIKAAEVCKVYVVSNIMSSP